MTTTNYNIYKFNEEVRDKVKEIIKNEPFFKVEFKKIENGTYKVDDLYEYEVTDILSVHGITENDFTINRLRTNN